MRIGFILPNLAGGGAEKAVLQLASALLERNHRVDLILLDRIAMYVPAAGIEVHALAADGQQASKGWLGKRLTAWKLSRLISRLTRVYPFDLFVSTLPFADEVAILAGLPRHWCRIANTLSAEIARLAESNHIKAARRMARYRRMYSNRSLIAVSEGVREDLRGAMGFAQTRIEVIPNPFDFSALNVLAVEPTNLPAKPYVIHVGRFSPQKRHDVLLDAFARLPTSHRLVLLVEPQAALLRMIETRELETRVIVAGFQRNPYPWIAGADLLALSSDHEGLPNVLIEALSLGVPVVSTDCPSGPREILGGMLPGCLVPVGDAPALTAAMKRVLENPPNISSIDLSRYAMPRAVEAYERLAQERP